VEIISNSKHCNINEARLSLMSPTVNFHYSVLYRNYTDYHSQHGNKITFLCFCFVVLSDIIFFRCVCSRLKLNCSFVLWCYWTSVFEYLSFDVIRHIIVFFFTVGKTCNHVCTLKFY